MRTFGYLKEVLDPRIAIDHRPLVFDRIEPIYELLIPDFLEDYPHVKEEIDPNFLYSFHPVIENIFLCDSDHAHNQALSDTFWHVTMACIYLPSRPVPYCCFLELVWSMPKGNTPGLGCENFCLFKASD